MTEQLEKTVHTAQFLRDEVLALHGQADAMEALVTEILCRESAEILSRLERFQAAVNARAKDNVSLTPRG